MPKLHIRIMRNKMPVASTYDYDVEAGTYNVRRGTQYAVGLWLHWVSITLTFVYWHEREDFNRWSRSYLGTTNVLPRGTVYLIGNRHVVMRPDEVVKISGFSMRATPIPDLEAIYWDENSDFVLLAKGSFSVTVDPRGQRKFHLLCPGCGTLAPLALRPVVDGSLQSWEWDENSVRPTLNPSINHPNCWHGWLRKGEFIPVPTAPRPPKGK